MGPFSTWPNIDEDFTTPPYSDPFEKTNMRKLFAYGNKEGKAGHGWHKTPPGSTLHAQPGV